MILIFHHAHLRCARVRVFTRVLGVTVCFARVSSVCLHVDEYDARHDRIRIKPCFLDCHCALMEGAWWIL